MAEVKCYFCGGKVDKKEAVCADKKNYHPICYQTYLEKKDCCNYICGLFNLKVPGPKIYSQLSNFTAQYNYSYKNIKKTLQYCYEIKKMSRKKANEGIGIVPYQHDEAIRYFDDLESKQQRQSVEISKAIEKEKEKEHDSITTTTGRPRITRKYELY